jgi:uncharacterized membrane protein YqhA
MVRRLIGASRSLIALAVFGIAVAATATIAYATIVTVQVVAGPWRGGANTATTKALILGVIELVDLFLIGITLYIIALGLYELFFDQHLPSPPWLIIRDLDDLKAKVLGVVIVILAVLFLGQALTWDGERDLLRFSGAIALVIAALTYFLGQKSHAGEGTKPH